MQKLHQGNGLWSQPDEENLDSLIDEVCSTFGEISRLKTIGFIFLEECETHQSAQVEHVTSKFRAEDVRSHVLHQFEKDEFDMKLGHSNNI